MLRPYQSILKNEIYNRHELKFQNVLGVLPTGAGKTVVMADIFKDNENYPQIAIAHRQELVLQISCALANAGIYHRIVAPARTIRFVVERHVRKFTQSYYHPGAPTAVAGVDTLINRFEDLTSFLKQVRRWQTDEAHHLQINNKWGAAVNRMPFAHGVGWTATPMRPTGQSLGRSLSGVFDALCVGPAPRELINQGYLCDYKIYAPPLSMNVTGLDVSSATGDFNQAQLRRQAHKSKIVGDVVQHYLRLAPGKRNVVFAVDVSLAEEQAAAFNAAGIPAAVLHAKTNDVERVKMLDKFERGDLRVIVNVDVLGEGFDCPAIECVQFARPTQSYNLFVQQFGRGLRPLPGKSHGIIIDHVGNVERHGLPDTPREWSLDGVAKKPKRLDDDLPLRNCPNPACFTVFEGYGRTCPVCGHCPPRESASRPEQVEGDLIEFSPDLLNDLRRRAAEIVRENGKLPYGQPKHVIKAVRKKQTTRREAQLTLRETMGWWGGTRRDRYNDPDSDAFRRFFRTFGIDAATAKTLGATDAAELNERIWTDINRMKQELGE